jgi:two-component system heavy metal sensor histidine kinase CusS
VSAFNGMLMRLEDSFRRLSEVSSDMAHELRTPLHNLLLQTQVTLSRERDAADYRATLQSNLEELERLSRMVSDMLFLARADNREIALKREHVELGGEVAKLLGFYEALASDRGVRLEQSGAAAVRSDRLMIQRALSNLLSNAIRYTPAGQTVTVAVSQDAEHATVRVQNPGAQIPAGQLSKIFERLYRIDPSRREGNSDNVGLGLAITKSIVELHGGRVEAESEAGRTCFTLTLPLRD